MKSIEARLAKLEMGDRGAAVVAWCDDPADVETTVSAMIAEGQVGDREQLLLVHWETAAWAPRALATKKATRCADGRVQHG